MGRRRERKGRRIANALSYLFDDEYFVGEHLTLQDRVQVLQQQLQVLRAVSKWNHNGDAVSRNATGGLPGAARCDRGQG